MIVLALRGSARVLLPVHVGKLPGPLSRLRGRRLEILWANRYTWTRLYGAGRPTRGGG